MIGHVFIKPARGLVVRDPISAEPLPDAGIRVELNAYWRRRLAVGDVVYARTQSDSPRKGQSKRTNEDSQ